MEFDHLFYYALLILVFGLPVGALLYFSYHAFAQREDGGERGPIGKLLAVIGAVLFVAAGFTVCSCAGQPFCI